jgi:YfiR/HmsC-like
MAARARAWLCVLALALCAGAPAARAADELPEYRLKAAFLYNFALFTEWPAEVGGTLNLCVFGPDPFGKEIEGLQGKAVGERRIALQHKAGVDALKGCQIVFIAPAAVGQVPRVLEAIEGQAVLTVADSPGAARQGVALNMAVVQNKVSFEANLRAARAARINLSSKLLRLATEVIQ